MNIVCIIPARMESTRFPGKPMHKINGLPMIERVYRNVKKNPILSEVVVATCNKEIFNHINLIGGEAVMTSKKHKRASDRSYEALKKIEKKNKKKYEIVVMVQGDEPMVHPDMINEAVKPMLKDRKIKVLNLMGNIKNKKEFLDPNCIKVVCDKKLNAMYFSRSALPFLKFKKGQNIKKQVCIIPFRRDFLITYNSLKPTILEKIESIDILRVLENGFEVKMAKTKHFTQAVDTKSDALKVAKLIRRK